MKKSTEAKTARAKLTVKKKTRQKSDEQLTKIQKALRSAQAEIRLERHARLKAEKALSEARKELADMLLEAEQEPQVQIRRVSFVVRLIFDEHAKLGRTEIEHVSSSRKQNFLRLDGERLVAFIKTCVNPIMILEDNVPQAPSKE